MLNRFELRLCRYWLHLLRKPLLILATKGAYLHRLLPYLVHALSQEIWQMLIQLQMQNQVKVRHRLIRECHTL